MLAAKKNWVYPTKKQVNDVPSSSTFSEAFMRFCMKRGLETEEAIKAFMHPTEQSYHDPFLMYDMKKAVTRIQSAIEMGEAIHIFGDYDADGITSTAILVEVLESLGAMVSYSVPNRFSNGYGPSIPLFQQFIAEGAELIVTCDNGIAGHEAIEWAREQGVDVIVTDHHEPPEALPNAYAIVHPMHPAGSYPFPYLSGAGVALKVAGALIGEIPYEFFDLAAIGTVADLVSVTDENRWIIQKGIQQLKQTERLGLSKLFEKAGVKRDSFDEESIGFLIGPRLNALGRLKDATPGVELLLSFDEEAIDRIIEEIDETNRERQEVVKKVFEEANAQVQALERLPLVLVLHHPEWHEGVLGIVASRMVEEWQRPTILLHHNEENGTMKGSARSIDGFNLYEALQSSSSNLSKFGGHEMAAGLSLHQENVETFSLSLQGFAEEYRSLIEKGVPLYIDEVLSVPEVQLSLLEELEQLKPYGTDFHRPVFQIEGGIVQEVKQIGADKQHLKLNVATDTNKLDVIGFQFGEVANRISLEHSISLVGTLQINEWMNFKKPQLLLNDLAVSNVQFFDHRASKWKGELFSHQNSVYVYFQKSIFDQSVNQVPSTSAAVLLESDDDLPPFDTICDTLVIVDCPTNLSNLEAFLQKHPFENVFVYSYPIQQVTNEGMPSKQQLKTVYEYVRTHAHMDVRNKLEALAKYLKINKKLLIFILSVFLEANFVTIDNGIMNPVKEPQRIDLTETNAFKKREAALQAEKLFIYSPFATIEQWIKTQLSDDNRGGNDDGF